jgi:hypothetical protein
MWAFAFKQFTYEILRLSRYDKDTLRGRLKTGEGENTWTEGEAVTER